MHINALAVESAFQV